MTDKILMPCPFCGSDDVKIDSWDDGVWFFRAHCDTCDTSGAEYISERQAIELWNQRVQSELMGYSDD